MNRTFGDFLSDLLDKFEKRGLWEKLERLEKKIYNESSDKGLIVKKACVVSFTNLHSDKKGFVDSFFMNNGFSLYQGKWTKILSEEENENDLRENLYEIKKNYFNNDFLWFCIIEQVQ